MWFLSNVSITTILQVLHHPNDNVYVLHTLILKMKKHHKYQDCDDNTSSISLVFDFSNESTLEWRLLTVLLKLMKKKLIQTHSRKQEKVCYSGFSMLNDIHQLPCLNILV